MTKEQHRSTYRVVEILKLVSKHSEGLTLTQISEIIEAPKSSLYPILKTLSDERLLRFREEGNTYVIGHVSFEIGNSYLDNLNIMSDIKLSMTNIVNVCLETCHFATLVDGDVLYLQKIDSPESIRMISTSGKRLPAYGTGLGKALLMDHTKEELKKLYPNGLKKLTSKTIESIDLLYENIRMSRYDEFSYEIEESNDFVRCIAVPIRKKGTIIAAMSVAVPVFRYSDTKENLIKELLKSEREKIEKLVESTNIDFHTND